MQATFLSALEGRQIAGDGEPLLAKLVADGVLIKTSTSPDQGKNAPEAERDLRERSRGYSAGILSVRLLLSYVLELWTSSGRTLKSRLDSIRDARSAQHSNSDTDKWGTTTKVAAACRICDRTISPKDRCLSRSIATARLLTRLGVPNFFFIGVKSNPFEAHSWVQVEDCVINDSVDAVAPFTPILVL